MVRAVACRGLGTLQNVRASSRVLPLLRILQHSARPMKPPPHCMDEIGCQLGVKCVQIHRQHTSRSKKWSVCGVYVSHFPPMCGHRSI